MGLETMFRSESYSYSSGCFADYKSFLVKFVLHLIVERVLKLQGANQEEPRRLFEWLSAILSRRICEMSPVGADLVLLLNRLIGLSNTDKLEKGFLEFATSLLQKIYTDLTMRILPRIIGTKRMWSATNHLREGTKDVTLGLKVGLFRLPYSSNHKTYYLNNAFLGSSEFCNRIVLVVLLSWLIDIFGSGPEQTIGAEPLSFNIKDGYTGYSLFIDNLKNNLKRLWAELLNNCSESISAQYLGPTSSTDKDSKLSGDTPGFEGWWNGDPFVGLFRITILSSGHHAVAEVLAEETFVIPSDREGSQEKSVRRLFLVMEVMKMVAGQGRGVQVFEIWSQLCVTLLNKSDNEMVTLPTSAKLWSFQMGCSSECS
jgi:hypothetical protein